MRERTHASSETRSRARHGLAIYFAVLAPLSAAVSAFAIIKGNANWAVLAMPIPALASIVARKALHEGFADIGFHFRDRRVQRYIGYGIVLPIAVASAAYGAAWST